MPYLRRTASIASGGAGAKAADVDPERRDVDAIGVDVV